MMSRALTRRIDIYQTGTSSDGFGGSLSTQTLIGSCWAELKTISPGSIVNQYGDKIPERSILVTIRKRNDLNLKADGMFIEYNSKQYIINTAPIDTNFTGKFISFTMSEIPTRAQ